MLILPKVLVSCSLLSYLRNVPLAVNDLVVCWNVVADQGEDHHHHVLGHAHHIGACISIVWYLLTHVQDAVDA